MTRSLASQPEADDRSDLDRSVTYLSRQEEPAGFMNCQVQLVFRQCDRQRRCKKREKNGSETPVDVKDAGSGCPLANHQGF